MSKKDFAASKRQKFNVHLRTESFFDLKHFKFSFGFEGIQPSMLRDCAF